MAAHSRLRLLIVATAMLVVISAFVFGIYFGRLPSFFTGLLNRPVTEPSAEEYAVFSAFIDGFANSKPFQADQWIAPNATVYIVAETLRMQAPGSILPLDVAALGPEEMGRDFFRQNAHAWHLQPRFQTQLKTKLLGGAIAGRAALSTDAPDICGVMRLSRAGFNRRRTLAMLFYSYRCGLLCGQSGWVLLAKVGGQWQIKEFGSGVIN